MSHSKNIIQSPKNPVEHGTCWCGCGERTPIATYTDNSRGIKKGEPIHFMTGHHRRISHVEYVVEDRGHSTPCWIWQRGLDGKGYGQTTRNGKEVPAHRAFYEDVHGTVDSSLFIDHLCRVRSCVNPDHMEPVTCAENLRRGIQTKLNREQVEWIRVNYATGNWTQRAIAEVVGVAPAYISQIVHFKTWRS